MHDLHTPTNCVVLTVYSLFHSLSICSPSVRGLISEQKYCGVFLASANLGAIKLLELYGGNLYRYICRAVCNSCGYATPGFHRREKDLARKLSQVGMVPKRLLCVVQTAQCTWWECETCAYGCRQLSVYPHAPQRVKIFHRLIKATILGKIAGTFLMASIWASALRNLVYYRRTANLWYTDGKDSMRGAIFRFPG